MLAYTNGWTHGRVAGDLRLMVRHSNDISNEHSPLNVGDSNASFRIVIVSNMNISGEIGNDQSAFIWVYNQSKKKHFTNIIR